MDDFIEAFQAAIARGDQEAVKNWLAQHKNLINSIRDEMGRTPLHWAGSCDNYQIPPMLLQAGADPYARDDAGQLPMDFAAGERETEGRWILRAEHQDNQLVLKHLLERSKADARKTLAFRASRALVRRLDDGRTALMLACEAGRADLVRLLLAAGAPPGDVDWLDERDAVFLSIEANHADCLQIILAADPSLRDRWHRYLIDSVPALLQPLHFAAWTGSLACVEVLLDGGAPVDARARGDGHVWTPLHLAALQGHTDIVRRLLAAGADAALAEGVRGFNALQLAMEQNRAEVVSLIEAWAKDRGIDLLRPFHQDTNETELKFPLYRAPLRLAPGHCTICDQDKPHCMGVSHLLAPCPSCGATKAYNTGDAGEVTRCESCDRLGEWPDQWPRERDEIRVCYECLRSGHAGIAHRTALGTIWPPYVIRGMISAHGGDEAKAAELGFKTTVLESYDDGSYRLGIHVPQHLLDELMRTPCHPSMQDEYWPFHCGGWMVYVGMWRPKDFERRAPGHGVDWLRKHCDDPEMAEEYWSWLESDIARSCVYACPRCGLHKAWVDAD